MSGIPVDSGELRYWREKRVLSCQELAAAAGVASTVVYALENGYAPGRARPETYRAGVLRGSGLLMRFGNSEGSEIPNLYVSLVRRPRWEDNDRDH